MDSVFAVPTEIKDPLRTAKVLSALTGVSTAELLDRFDSPRSFVWIKRKITASEASAIERARLPGVYFQKEDRRFYPKGEMAAHVLGYVNIDEEGMGGLEYRYNEKVRGESGKVVIMKDARRTTYGRIEIQQAALASDLGTAGVSGTLTLAGDAAPAGNHLRGHLAKIDVDRLLDAIGVRRRVDIGSNVDGDVDVTLSDADPFGANWWRQTNAGGPRWTIDHRLRSAAGPTVINGTLSGEASQSADGAFESTLSGRSRVQIGALHALAPFIHQAGVELPTQINDIDATIDAVIDSRGTLSAPRALATITGRAIRLPGFPEGQLDSTIAVSSVRLTIDSLQAALGPASVNASGSYPNL